MFKAEVVKGFRYQVVRVTSKLEMVLGIVPKDAVTKHKYVKGQRVSFDTHDEYKEFRNTAIQFGGEVRCVGLPPRP